MKRLLSVIAILLLVGSCSDEQPVRKEESLVDSFMSSNSFSKLNVGLSDLDISKAIIRDIDIHAKSVLIPFKGKLKYVYGEGSLSQQDILEFKEAVSLEYVTNQTYEQLSKSIEKNSFSGELKVESSRNYALSMTFLNGKFEGTKMLKSSKIETCSGTVGSNQWVQDVADCASGRIDNMNWWDKTWCYAALPECWAQTVISCVIDECETIAGP